MDSSRFEPQWVYAAVTALGVAVVSIMVEFAGFFFGIEALWLPAAVVFPVSVVIAMVCTAVLLRQSLASRNR